MKKLVFAVILLSSPAYAGGFFLGGMSDGMNSSCCENDYQRRLDREFEADRQRRQLQENNQILRDQRDRQIDQDTNRIFRQYDRR